MSSTLSIVLNSFWIMNSYDCELHDTCTMAQPCIMQGLPSCKLHLFFSYVLWTLLWPWTPGCTHFALPCVTHVLHMASSTWQWCGTWSGSAINFTSLALFEDCRGASAPLGGLWPLFWGLQSLLEAYSLCQYHQCIVSFPPRREGGG